MALYHDYRPTDLDEVVGNKSTVKSLKAMLDRDEDVPHAFLFTGGSGCGKTTLGRILANAMGVYDPERSKGMNPNYREVDSADFRGIDSIREIRQQMNLTPMGGGKARVWLLDECHKLTNEAQNALLKALEDPPDHVYFILCTTNPEKLLKTIKSRCTVFNVEPLGQKTMLRFLNEICEEEEVEVPQDVLKLIAKNSQGHPRAALVALDKIIDLDEDDMLEAAEQAAEEESQVIDLCQALIKRSPWKKVSEILNGLKNKEPESIRWAVLGYCNSVMLNSATPNPNAYLVMDAFRENFYDTKHFGLTLACYEALEAE